MRPDVVQRRVKGALITGLAYGLGLSLGNVVSRLLFGSISLNDLGIIGNPDTQFALGVLLVYAIAMIGGGIGGFAGGWTLPTPKLFQTLA